MGETLIRDKKSGLHTNKITAVVLKAMAVFSGVQVIGILCSILRSKFVALWIGPVGVGLLAIYNSVVELISSATQLNISQSAVRDISAAEASQRPRLVGAVRWWGARLGVFGAVAIMALSPLLSYVSFGSIDKWWAFSVLSIAVASSAVTGAKQAVMQGSQRLRRLAKASVTGAMAGTLLSIPLYRYFGEASIVPGILVMWVSGAAAAYWYDDVKGSRGTRAENIKAGRGFLVLGAYLTISMVATTLASYVFMSYLNRSASTEVTGYYQAGYTLVVRYVGIVFIALATEYYPRLSRVADRPGMASVVVSHEMMLLVSMLAPMVVVFIAADRLAIYILYSSDFYAVLPYVTLAICGTVFRAVSYCMVYVILARGEGRVYVITEVLSAVIGLALNIAGFHWFGFVGLGISYILWYAIYTVIVGMVYFRIFGLTLAPGVIRLCLWTLLIIALSLVLKTLAWWAVLPMLIPALYLTFTSFRKSSQ